MNNEEFIRHHFGDEVVDKYIAEKTANDLLDGKLFFCNPDKHKGCYKTSCYRNGGECMMTKYEIFSW